MSFKRARLDCTSQNGLSATPRHRDFDEVSFCNDISLSKINSPAKIVVPEEQELTLYHKKTGSPAKFKLYQEDELPFVHKEMNTNVLKQGSRFSIGQLNVQALEEEYDYDTDGE